MQRFLIIIWIFSICESCHIIKLGIEYKANQNCKEVKVHELSQWTKLRQSYGQIGDNNNVSTGIVYFVHLYPDFTCMAEFPIEFHFDGDNVSIHNFAVRTYLKFDRNPCLIIFKMYEF